MVGPNGKGAPKNPHKGVWAVWFYFCIPFWGSLCILGPELKKIHRQNYAVMKAFQKVQSMEAAAAAAAKAAVPEQMLRA